jgi:hypothetical protein
VSEELARGWAAFEAEDFVASERFFRRARNEVSTMNEARVGLIFVFVRTGRFDLARDECHSMRLEAQALGDLQAEYAAVHQFGIVERLAGDLEAALTIFAEERELIARLESPPLAVSANAFEEGILRARLGDLDGGRDWLRISLEAAQLVGDATAEACALRGLGEIAANGTMRKALLVQSAAAFERAGDDLAVQEVRALLEVELN